MDEYISINTEGHKIANGDVLLFRAGTSLVSRLISGAGRGRHCHAAIATWWSGDLFCLEVREWFGGRAILLEREVARRPGLIDVYRLVDELRTPGRVAGPVVTGPEFDMLPVLAKMRRFAGGNYGWWSVLRAALYHLPILRLALKPMTDDQMENGHPPYCSQAVSYSYRAGGGVDLVPNSADCVTEPADLARSGLLQYKFTLRP